MKRAYQKVMSVLLVCLFVISGCSSGNSDASASPKQVLLDAVEYSNQQEGFREEFDNEVTSEDGVNHTLSDSYIIFPSQACYQVSFNNAVGGSYKDIYIGKYTQTDIAYIQGTPSSTSFRDMTVTNLDSYEGRNETFALTIPIRSPLALKRPPPELPGLTAASVCRRVIVCPSIVISRSSAEMMQRPMRMRCVSGCTGIPIRSGISSMRSPHRCRITAISLNRCC